MDRITNDAYGWGPEEGVVNTTAAAIARSYQHSGSRDAPPRPQTTAQPPPWQQQSNQYHFQPPYSQVSSLSTGERDQPNSGRPLPRQPQSTPPLGRLDEPQSRSGILPRRPQATTTSTGSSNLSPGYYRLYWEPSSDMESRFPLYDNDLSVSEFYHEKVSPPRRCENYLAYICEREHIHPSRVKLWVNVSRRSDMEDLRVVSPEETIRREPCGATPGNPFLVTVRLDPDLMGERDRVDARSPLPVNTISMIGKAFGSIIPSRKQRAIRENRRMQEEAMKRARQQEEPPLDGVDTPTMDGRWGSSYY